ncbi:MAG TPA: CDP-alcohol phosphatidyltransferase family protein, partial [Gammaproteobacteria bacterium]|nr:CDP-alcohol phosphatidyltransferase family protein [Gammaproteobacteria bacterium]
MSSALGVAAVAAAGLALAVSIDALLSIDAAFVRRTFALLFVGGAVVLSLAARRLDAPRFGVANVVTLARGALTLLLVAVLTAPGTAKEPAAAIGWLLVALALPAVILDGFDGRLARARGET